MRGYKVIRVKNGYRFVLYPINSNSIPMGESCLYNTEKECRLAIDEFSMLVKNNKFDTENSLGVKIIKKNDKFFFEYVSNSKVVFYRTIGFDVKYNCVKAIKGIFQNIDEYTKNEKSE